MNKSRYKGLLRNAISSRTLEVNTKLKKNSDLLQSGFLLPLSTSGSYKINVTTQVFLELLTQLAEEALKEKIPHDILGVLEFVSKYESYLKHELNDSVFNSFSFIIDPLNVHALAWLHRQGYADIIAFYDALKEHRVTHSKLLWNYEGHFFDALPFLDLGVADVFDILIRPSDENSKEHIVHEKNQFLTRLPEIDFNLALNLYRYGKKNGLDKVAYFLPVLLAHLYKSGYKQAIKEAKALYKVNQNSAVVFFGSIQYESSSLVDYVIKLFQDLDKENVDLCCNYVYSAAKLLNQPITGETRADTIFQNLFTLLLLRNQRISNSVANALTWLVEGHEEQRYKILKAALSDQLFDVVILKSYFHNFTSPRFFFSLYLEMYAAFQRRLNLKLFDEGMMHFVNSCYGDTENEVLNLLTHDDMRLRIAIVELWLRSARGRRLLNFLSLDSEQKQLRVVEVITMYPYGMEELLPSLLELRKSSFQNVVVYLQRRLCMLVFDAYHDYAFESISSKLTNTKQDKKFLEPIQGALAAYQTLREKKKKIKDIDPWANEKSYIQLYYKLEAERNARMMNEITSDESSFLQHGHSIIIVRGNAWKIEGRDVAPLGKLESSVTLDSRMFKNPDQLEIELSHPRSQF